MFKSKTGVQARSFNRQGPTNNRPPAIVSISAEVTGYGLPENSSDGIGVLFAKRLSDGKDIEVYIKRAKVDAQLASIKADPNKKADAGSFHGALINAAMQDEIKVGDWIVIENATLQKTVKVGNVSRQVFEANWIHHAAAPTGTKLIEGVMTSDTPYDGRVNNIQVWGEPLSVTNDEDKVKALIEDYDARAASWDKDARLPRHGFRLRAITRNGDTREIYNAEKGSKVPTEVATVLSRTYPIEWVYERAQEQGGAPQVDRPVSGEDLANDIDGFMDYMTDRYPNVSYDIEVMPYTSYFASRTHNSFRVNEFGPLKSMATTPILLEPNVPGEDPEEPKVGKNFGVYGILLIIDDKIDRVNGRPVVTEQYMAQKFFGNARTFRGELDKLIRAADGTPVVTPPELDAPKVERQGGAERAAPSAADQRTAAANSVSGGFDDLTDTNTPFDTDDATASATETFGDAFAGGFDEAPEAEAETEVVDTTTTAPAAAPAGRSRFAR